jgi:hypothetical protein
VNEQLALDGLPAAEPTLTERQELALMLVRELGPLASTDLGWRLRELRGGRASGAEFDRSNGRAIGEALAVKGLVRYVRGEGWVDARGPDRESADRTAYDPRSAEIPY